MSKYKNVDLRQIAYEAMDRYGFRSKFSPRLLKEVEKFNERRHLKNRGAMVRDLRTLLWSSIDNEDSEDLDQLEYCERGRNNEIHVKVAIADVDLFVPKGSEADDHAAFNGNSVYTGIETFPMLPLKLSAGLTSLLPDMDRSAMVTEFRVRPDGSVIQGEIYPAIVCNKAKLVYESVGDWLLGKTGAPAAVVEIPGLQAQIELQNEAAVRLQDFRRNKGAIDLEMLEPRAVIQNQKVEALIVPEDNPARSIIENFMIAANGTVMGRLAKAKVPVIERLVRVPKNWEGIVELAQLLGTRLPSTPNPKALSDFLLRRKKADPERFPDLSLSVVKLLGPGEYAVVEAGKPPIGHFGLAAPDYTHSTAPNRRYIDVLIQRILKSVVLNQPCPYSPQELNRHAVWCTDRDKAATKVERFMRKAAAAVLLLDRVGHTFDGIVTGASFKGTFVRLIDPPVEGRVMRGEAGLIVGEHVRVRLTGLNPYKGHVDLERVGQGTRDVRRKK